jgi:uncharacterized membrane-anchored protein
MLLLAGMKRSLPGTHRVIRSALNAALCGIFFGQFPLQGADPADPPPEASPIEAPTEKLGWKAGPITGELRGRARIEVPEGFRFLDHADAARLLVMAGNQSSGNELGLVQHLQDKWWAVFEFDEIGFVKDDDKNKLDPDKLLAAIKAGTEEGNKYRAEKGVPPMNILGWHVPPNYNAETKNLEWSVLAESSGQKFVNYNVRLLGRKGVTEITLVDDLASVDRTLPEFRQLLTKFTYGSGESYAEFRQGDKVAKYGLSALILGGAAALAYKVGFFGLIAVFFKKAWKLVVLGIAAIVTGIRKLIVGRESKPTNE